MSQLSPANLARVIGSFNLSGIVRDEDGGWSWVPVQTSAEARTVRDSQAIARLGAVLFQLLTGRPPAYAPSGQDLRAMLRALRPELPSSVADLTIRALTAGHNNPNVTLAVFAQELKRAAGIDPVAQRTRQSITWFTAVAAAILASCVIGWAFSATARERDDRDGVTPREADLVDIWSDTAQTEALTGEHSSAFDVYRQVGQLWSARSGPDDPRLAWTQVHQAWIRTLAGDRLTAEQILGNDSTLNLLARELGDRHPYTRTARLALATTLEARGAHADAAPLRFLVERATRDLMPGSALQSGPFDRAPVPPGVLAHVAPNPPAREGFRSGPEGRFFVPLTSIQRWMAGRNGWRLHLVASNSCRVSLVTGANPQMTSVRLARVADARWRVSVEGTSPELARETAAGAEIALSLAADPTGRVDISLADGVTRSATIATTGPPPVPPYVLSLEGGASGAGCDVVWLEIPFPPEATFTRSGS
jgi:hypothetical protein